MSDDSVAAPPGTLVHEALLHASDDELVKAVVGFLGEAVGSQDPVFVVAPESTLGTISEAMGAAASDISFLEGSEWYRRPAWALGRWYRTMQERLAAGARAVRIVSEIGFGETERERSEWTAFESILNRALASLPAHLLCLYDARRVPQRALTDAARTHPSVMRLGVREASGTYVAPEVLVPQLAVPQPEPVGVLVLDVTVGMDLAVLRRRVFESGRFCGVPDDRLGELVVAVNEIVTNAIIHGGGWAHVRVWCDGGRWTCEVEDPGGWEPGPLAGYLPPHPTTAGGMGLWVARQLCDGVEIRRLREGLAVRMWADL